MPRKGGHWSGQEKMFVERYAATNDATYAAEKAGYAKPVHAGSNLARKPAVQEDVRRRQLARVTNELLPLALDTIENILRDPKSTERGRLGAAKIVIDRGFAPGDAGEAKEAHELTNEELQARLANLRNEAANRAKPVIEHEPSAPPNVDIMD